MGFRRLLGVVVIAGAAVLVAPASGQATTVSCGQTITSNVVLSNDLTNCPGDGLLVRAANVTVDLNGHTIDGDGPVAGEGDGDLGIVNGFSFNAGDQAAFAGITVKNGTIRDFEVGVSFAGISGIADDGLITDLSIAGGGIGLYFANDNRVENNQLTGAGIGLDMSSGNRVTDNRVTGAGITVDESSRMLCCTGITDNLVARNTVIDAPEIGISFPSVLYEAAPRGNRFVGNTVRGSGADGINLGIQTAALVDGNTVTGSGEDGIDVGHEGAGGFEGFGDGTVTDNLANSNDALGINVDEGVVDGGGNRATGNGDPRQCVGVVCRPYGFLFGGGTPGQTFSAMSADAKRASRFFLYFPVGVKQLRAYLDGGGAASGSQVLRGVIYSDSGGQPGQPLARSFQATIPAGTAPGWVTLSLPFRVELAPGYYWLGLHSGANSGVARFGWNPRAGSRRFNLDNYLDGPASPFGPAPLDNQSIAIHTIGYVRPSG